MPYYVLMMDVNDPKPAAATAVNQTEKHQSYSGRARAKRRMRLPVRLQDIQKRFAFGASIERRKERRKIYAPQLGLLLVESTKTYLSVRGRFLLTWHLFDK
jgi:hypothetical protein